MCDSCGVNYFVVVLLLWKHYFRAYCSSVCCYGNSHMYLPQCHSGHAHEQKEYAECRLQSVDSTWVCSQVRSEVDSQNENGFTCVFLLFVASCLTGQKTGIVLPHPSSSSSQQRERLNLYQCSNFLGPCRTTSNDCLVPPAMNVLYMDRFYAHFQFVKRTWACTQFNHWLWKRVLWQYSN